MLNSDEIGKMQGILKKHEEDRTAFVFQALADSTRLKIFRLLARYHGLCVTDIAHVLNISVPAVSYQLKAFEVVGLVRKERMGKMICYELKKKDPLVKRILKVVQ